MNPYETRTRVSAASVAGFLLGVVWYRLWMGEDQHPIALPGYWIAALVILTVWFFCSVVRRDRWDRHNYLRDWEKFKANQYEALCKRSKQP